jgi:hypothetical protein
MGMKLLFGNKNLFMGSIVIGLVLLLNHPFPAAAQSGNPPVQWNTPQRIPSPDESNSWFPDLVVDRSGNVHVVWSETFTEPDEPTEVESVYYSMWDGSQWSQFIDIVAPADDIHRTALAIDHNDELHLLYSDSNIGSPFRLVYKTAHSNEAYSAANWTAPDILNEESGTYMSAIVVRNEEVHVLYEDAVEFSPDCENCMDIYYRKSPDLGDTWSSTMSLNPSGLPSSRPSLFVDDAGVIYAAWDEGWDRFLEGTPTNGIFMLSRDGGENWSEPLVISSPNSSNLQLTVAGNGLGGVLLVWRTISSDYPGVYFMASSDWGESWSTIETIPNLISGPVINYFDVYSMDVDSNHNIHLLAVGYPQTAQGSSETVQGLPGLYNLTWNGQNWSVPNQIYRGSRIPEYPQLTIHNGNELYATWFLRQSAFDPAEKHINMFSSGMVAAPRVEPTEPPAVEMPVSEQVNSNEGSPTETLPTEPAVTLEPVGELPLTNIYSENDEYATMLVALAPVVLLIGGVIIYVTRRKN